MRRGLNTHQYLQGGAVHGLIRLGRALGVARSNASSRERTTEQLTLISHPETRANRNASSRERTKNV